MIRRAGGLTGTKWERTNYIILQYIKYYIHDYACVHMMCSYIYMYIYIYKYIIDTYVYGRECQKAAGGLVCQRLGGCDFSQERHGQ